MTTEGAGVLKLKTKERESSKNKRRKQPHIPHLDLGVAPLLLLQAAGWAAELATCSAA